MQSCFLPVECLWVWVGGVGWGVVVVGGGGLLGGGVGRGETVGGGGGISIWLNSIHYKSMGANDPRGVASLGPRGLISWIYVGDN